MFAVASPYLRIFRNKDKTAHIAVYLCFCRSFNASARIRNAQQLRDQSKTVVVQVMCDVITQNSRRQTQIVCELSCVSDG